MSINPDCIESAAAIGSFDGVHRGHQEVLKSLSNISSERGFRPLVITFRSHPLTLINPARAPKVLTPLWKKKILLEEQGVKPIIVEFDEATRKSTAEEWMRRLRDEYNVKLLVMGFDNTFGSDGINLSLRDFTQIGERVGIEVVEAPKVEGVSSSAIRKAVAHGDMETARSMLGRPYSITSKVVRGNSLGRRIGYPTANIKPSDDIALPQPGVYAAIVKTLKDGRKHPAMVNIGSRPTVMRGDDMVVEAHLIDWQGDLYDKDITVRFLKRLREEKKFDSIDTLKAQLAKDRAEVLKLLNE